MEKASRLFFARMLKRPFQLTFLKAFSLMTFSIVTIANGQTGSNAPSQKPITSLADSLSRSNVKQLHILYVHGMAADGPGDFDSWGLRKSICDRLGDCISPAGELDGHEFADEDEFALNSSPPNLAYMGHPIWDKPEEWNAAAPFVTHWRLERKTGTSVYVDEINWWPLVFALKCRQIIQTDAALVGPDTAVIDRCSVLKTDSVPGRYVSYPWITPEDAQRLKLLPLRGAKLNRSLKNSIMDWGFSDAVLSVGALRPLLLDGIRQLVLKSANVGPDGNRGIATALRPDQEFVIVSHSLGSYLIFAALDYAATASDSETTQRSKVTFDSILSHTSMVYFFANQLRLLELANLDDMHGANMIDHLETWGNLRTTYLEKIGVKDAPPPQIVAWNDPSDLLTWDVPTLTSVRVSNRSVKNATHWFWLFENPTKAHDHYAQNSSVIREMLKPIAPISQ